MTSTLLVLLSQTEQPAPFSAGAVPSLAASFAWGRVDVDERLAAQLTYCTVEVALSGLALGLGQPGARHLYSGQVRWRFSRTLYGLGEGRTLLRPRADGALRPAAYVSLGLGVDNAC